MSSATVPTAPPAAPAAPPGRAATWAGRVLWANLVGQVAIVVTGGVVRLTGSGLGCSTWPQCEPGQFTPVMHEAVSWHPYIEFGNRTLTGVLGILALATAFVVWRQTDRAPAFRLLGLVPLGGVIVQAVVGGLTVLVDLHPAVVGLHFMISMILVAASAAVLVRHGEGDGPPRLLVGRTPLAIGRALVPLAVVVLVLGVVTTGSGPHSGDEEVAYRFTLDPAEISRFHSAAVWVYVLAVVALVVLVHRRGTTAAPPARARRAALVLLGITLLQGLIGYVQYFTGLPGVLVAAHMLGASLLVVAQVNQLFSMRERPAVHA